MEYLRKSTVSISYHVFIPGFLTLILLSAGCSLTTDNSTDTGDNGVIGTTSTLFIPDSDSTGNVHFETNDVNYWSPSGYTLWALRAENPHYFQPLDITVTKTSGDDNAGYGLVINSTYDPDYGTTMLILMINNNGQYLLGEFVDENFYILIDWTDSTALIKGPGSANRMEVTYDSNSCKFNFSFNGNDIDSVILNSPPLHNYGVPGYLAVISPYDSFPDTPVIVDFQNNL